MISRRFVSTLLLHNKRKLDMSCVQLAEFEHKDLFLNADLGFDSRDLKKILEKKEIIAKIKQNPRNGQGEDVYFDEKLYKNRFKIERSFACLMDLKA